MGRPDLILLDEPTVGLDIKERLRLQEVLDEIRGQQPLLVATHILDDIQNPKDEIILFCNGKVAFQGSPAELKERAEGLVWLVPEQVFQMHREQLTQITQEERDGGRYVRVLDRRGNFSHAAAVPAAATVQDGYLRILSGEKGQNVPGR